MEDMEQLDKARERIIETIAQNIHLYGLTPSAGRLYGMMFFQRKPLTLDEMKEELGMSKTSMSTSVRALSDLKMVERVWKKGVRKDLYQAEEDWYQSFIDLFSTKWESAISVHKIEIKKSLAELKKLVSDEHTSEDVIELARVDIEKLEYIYAYFEWLERVVESFESHEIFDFVPKKKE
ncbi:HTH-type transcriptional repressor OpcR [Lederbergia ruris]|uniref:HTH-type transcriptional regulator n=1 Tax=Lederbergia ruris TaxID=217495 RepID=A0ABQ4KMV8_9BACI|nr:GbsR/MarR family transcriptional regulator [Lederbergia ruris]GIN59262.1 HTH-type transcriptional repressor OpcR [Lederbergia ruris]